MENRDDDPLAPPVRAHAHGLYGATRYEWKSPVSGIVNKLFKKYQNEGVVMPYTMEDYQREAKEEVLGSLTGEEIDRFLNSLNPEDRLKGLNPEEIEAYLKKIKEGAKG